MLQRPGSAFHADNGGEVFADQDTGIAPDGHGKLQDSGFAAAAAVPDVDIDVPVMQLFQQRGCEACRQHSPCKRHLAHLRSC